MRLISARLVGLWFLLLLIACGGPPAATPAPVKPPSAPTVPIVATPASRPAGPPANPTATATNAGLASSTPALAVPAGASATAGDLSSVRLIAQPLVNGLERPVQLTHAGDGSGRLFVVEKNGRIRIIRQGQLLAQPFLDLSQLVRANESERGLLGLAFHPAYTGNGLLFVNYSDRNGDTVIARYRVDAANPDRAEPASAKIIMQIKQPFANHNGGLVLFGPDGYLWIGTGDGGSANDPSNNGQNPRVLLGKMLRIDVDRGEPYVIPPDNPHRADNRYAPEIWAIGLRNPWRYSFDRATGDLYIADVGQNRYEEIHVTSAGSPGGLNYGWNVMEGRHCFRPTEGCASAGLDQPVFEYGRSLGCSVTGGHVYRGQRSPVLTGIYLFGDFCSGRLWGLRSVDGTWQSRELLTVPAQLSSFGEDEAGEIYLTGYNTGQLYLLTAGRA